MKKYNKIQFIFVISLLVSALLPLSNAKAQISSAQLTVNNLATQLQTPEQIAKFMWKNFRVESDQAQFGREEYWQAPAELLQNRRGDCEDLARFAYELLKKNGLQAFMLNVYGKKFAHTVCVFKQNGFYHVIDGTDVKRTNATNLKDVFTTVFPFWEKGAIVKASPKTKKGMILKQIERRVKAFQSAAIAS